MARKPQLPVGIKLRGRGYLVTVRVDGDLKHTSFAGDTPIPVMVKWREDQREQFGTGPVEHGSFTADILAYLAKPKIAAQRYAKQKAGHLAQWERALGGDRRRASITQDEIEAVLQDWLQTLSPVTVYHRRATLLHLYTTLDERTPEQIHSGIPEAPNPVKRTTCPSHWTKRNRSAAFETLKKIYDTMPDERIVRKGIRQPSIAKLVVGVILHTGVRAADLKRVRRSQVNLTTGIVHMPATLKGRRGNTIAADYPLHLTPDALAAFRRFDAADAYGQFSPEAVSHSFKRAARTVDGPETPIHLYMQRHAVGAELYRLTHDLETVGRALGHAPGSRATTQYALDAHADVDRVAIDKLAASRAAAVAPPAKPKPAKPRRRARGKRAA